MSPRISVCLITYNHEKYIEQCIESIVTQDCTESFEIIIGEDKSTDNTPSIVEFYRNKYPALIRVITSEKNVGMVENWRRTIFASKGEYVAIIEGDDYWSSPFKLQQQFDLMDKHPEYALCFHDVNVTFENAVPQVDSIARFPGQTEFTIADVIVRNWFIATCSMFVRKNMLSDFPPGSEILKGIDMMVQLLASSHGNIAYIDSKLGTYRLHISGQSQVLWLGRANTIGLTVISILKVFDRYTNGKYRKFIDQRAEKEYRLILSMDSPWSKYYFRAMFELILLNPRKNTSLLKSWFIINCIPSSVYQVYRKLKK